MKHIKMNEPAETLDQPAEEKQLSELPLPMSPLIGRRFSRLNVVSVYRRNKKTTVCVCICRCGNTTKVLASNLKRGATRSCGCLYKETRGFHSRTHGLSKTPEYKVWKKMRERCVNPNCKDYRLYGGRGITICAPWMESFENFLADMGKRPPGTSLDRIDGNKGYGPENCRWATSLQQANNVSRNRVINLEGIERTMSEWCRLFHMPLSAVSARINSLGWTPEKALRTPIRGRK